MLGILMQLGCENIIHYFRLWYLECYICKNLHASCLLSIKDLAWNDDSYQYFC